MRRVLIGLTAVLLAAGCAPVDEAGPEDAGPAATGDRATTTTVTAESGTPGAAGEEGGAERMVSLWASATVLDDGSAEIVEVIEWDFGGRPDRHGLVREVPGLAPGSAVTAESATAPDQAQVEWVDVGGERRASIRVGDPDVVVTGIHRYVLSFTVAGVATADGLAWDAVGTEWDVPFGPTEVHVVAPFDLVDPACYQGGPGTSGPCDASDAPAPGHLVGSADALAPNEGITIQAGRGAPLDAPPTPTPPS